jgi:HK97 gp10 family phage protein
MSEDPSIAAFERKFAAIPAAVREAARMALERNAEAVVADMKRVAPVDDGDLRDSIGWTRGDAPAGTMIIGRVGRQKYGALRITIYAGGSTAFYARFQEFGTVKMSANPFFFPVWRARRRRTRTSITRAINKAIKDAASR